MRTADWTVCVPRRGVAIVNRVGSESSYTNFRVSFANVQACCVMDLACPWKGQAWMVDVNPVLERKTSGVVVDAAEGGR
jgi:hypothetical protein